MLQDQLNEAFKLYWKDMDLCRSAGAYWSLLHVTVCLPDICAALQSDDGKATPSSRYKDWCKQYLHNAMLDEVERYEIRCKLLHQGYASADKGKGRYKGFSFAQPIDKGPIIHNTLDGDTLILDVDMLSKEMRKGVEDWIQHLGKNPSSPEASYTMKNLPSLVRVRQFTLPIPPVQVPGQPPITPSTTNVTRSS
jgi:hypothetical protein